MNRIPFVSASVLALCLVAGCASSEQTIAVSDVPDAVLAAARQAVPGLDITEAEREETRTGAVYEEEGLANGKAYEIEITAEGEVLEIEEEDADNDDGP